MKLIICTLALIASSLACSVAGAADFVGLYRLPIAKPCYIIVSPGANDDQIFVSTAGDCDASNFSYKRTGENTFEHDGFRATFSKDGVRLSEIAHPEKSSFAKALQQRSAAP